MPHIADDKVFHLEVAVKGIIDVGGSNSQNTQFVFHFKRAAVTPALNKSAMDITFQATIGVKILDCLNERWTQTANELRFIDDALDQASPFSHNLPGLVAGDSLPADAAVFMLFRTGTRGRSYKGGKHFGPISEADIGADVLLAPAITRFQALATAIGAGFTDVNGNVFKPVVFSRYLSKADKNPTTIVTSAVTEILFNKRIGRERSRQPQSIY